MSRSLLVAAAQLGPIQRSDSRKATVDRLVELLREGASRRAELVVFPEAALTPFFPHWLIEDPAELDSYFEESMPNPGVQRLFDEAAALGVGFTLGYGELARQPDGTVRRFNSSILVERDGRTVGHYRKIHLPGHREVQPGAAYQNLEKRYFEVGDLGFGVWDAFGGRVGMCTCNDRRWPETYRVMALKGVELVLLGYNTPALIPEMPGTERLADFHNRLCMQAGAYQNGTWVVGVAKAGVEAGIAQIGGTCVIAPSGEIVAQAATDDDEVVTARVDLDACRVYKETLFNFAAHRRPEHYTAISDPVA